MLKAGFTSENPEWAWLRQFPNQVPVWDGVEFVLEGDFSQCDVIICYGDTLANCPRGMTSKRSVFVSPEPCNFKYYLSRFLNQFDVVLTSDPDCRHKRAIFDHQGLPWHVGAFDAEGKLLRAPMTYDDFKTFAPKKTKTISVVSSNKAMTRSHRERLNFATRLKTYFGSEIDFFGRNIKSFADKTDVLSDYRYHIAIENYHDKYYWTEKLSDPFLTLTYPIYSGCTNIFDYFTSESLTPISIHDPEGAIRTIRKIIDSDLAERMQPALKEARRSVLEEHNLFAVLSRLAKKACELPERPHTLMPEGIFPRDQWRRLKRKFQSI